MMPFSLTGGTSRSDAAGYFSGGPAEAIFGDFNINYGAGGGVSSAAGVLPSMGGVPQWVLIVGAVAVVWMLRKSK